MSNKLDKIKEIAEQMPESLEKEQVLQAYSNLKTFEMIADSFESLINPASGEKEREARNETCRFENEESRVKESDG